MMKRIGRISLIIGLTILFTSLINANLEPSIKYGFGYPTSTYLIITFPVNDVNFTIGALPGSGDVYKGNMTLQLLDDTGKIITEVEGLTPLHFRINLYRRGVYMIRIMKTGNVALNMPISIEIKRVNIEYDKVYAGSIISVLSAKYYFPHILSLQNFTSK